jgi:ribosome maturation factor RimP
MNGVTALKNIEDFVTGVTEKSGTIFPVEIKISPSNDIKVFLDADDGITIEKCTLVNKALYKYIEETELFPGGNFSLEVSSPGLDEPLKSLRQYKKNVGRTVQVVTQDGAKTEGRLLNVNDREITIEEKIGKGKKAIVNTKNILFNEIKNTIVLITF